MRGNAGGCRLVVVLVSAVVAPGIALGQEGRPRTPLERVVARTDAVPEQPRLELGMSSYVSRDDLSSANAGVNAMLTYFTSGDRASLTATTSAGLWHGQSRTESTGHSASVGFQAPIGRRTTVMVQQSGAYLPFYDFRALPSPPGFGAGEVLASTSERSVSTDARYQYQTSVRGNSQVGRRSFLTFAYGLLYADFADDDVDLTTHSGRFGYEREVTRNGRFRAGYGYDEGGSSQTAVAFRSRIHSLDLGGDYTMPWSQSRRTNLTFSVGPAVMSRNQTRSFVIEAQAALDHTIGRRWTVTGTVGRATQFVEPFPEPFFGHSVGVSLRGTLGRSLRLTAQGEYGTGTREVGSAGNAYDTYTVSLQLQGRLTPTLSFGGGYSYYRYLFEEGAPLPGGLASAANGQMVRVGLTYRVPLMGEREPRGSR